LRKGWESKKPGYIDPGTGLVMMPINQSVQGWAILAVVWP